MVVKVTVPHFLTADAASLYMLGSGDVQLYEVKAFEGDFHSWFVGQTVQRGWCHYSLLRYSAEVVHKLIFIVRHPCRGMFLSWHSKPPNPEYNLHGLYVHRSFSLLTCIVKKHYMLKNYIISILSNKELCLITQYS